MYVPYPYPSPFICKGMSSEGRSGKVSFAKHRKLKARVTKRVLASRFNLTAAEDFFSNLRVDSSSLVIVSRKLVAGTVLEINEDLPDNSQKLNEEPYEGGWMIKLKVKDVSEVEALMDAAAYEKSYAE